MQKLAKTYSNTTKIRLVQDNLNTHHISAFYEHLPADEAFELAQKFEFYYTPKSASWLNMIEIEFSALAKQYLNRKILAQQQLEDAILAIAKERNDKQVKIDWQFSIKKGRNKLNRHYQALYSKVSVFFDKSKKSYSFAICNLTHKHIGYLGNSNGTKNINVIM